MLVPTTYNNQPPPPSPIALLVDSLVKELIREETMTWKEELIEKLLWEEEAIVIKQIPLSRMRPQDELIWIGTQDGNYTVHSAYWQLIEREEASQPSNSIKNESNVIWKTLWKINVTAKVKHFL